MSASTDREDSLARNILATLSSRLVIVGLAMATSIALARLLGPENRGVVALILLLPDFAKSFGLFGFDQAHTVYAGLEVEKRRVLVWHSLGLAGVLGGGVAGMATAYLAFGGPGSHAILHAPLWLYVVPLSLVPAALAGALWGAILRGANRIILITSAEVAIRAAALVLFVLLVGWWHLDVPGAIAADALATLGSTLIFAFLLSRVDLWGRPSFDWALWTRTARFAVPSHVSGLMTYLNYRLDQFIIAAFLPPEQLGFYVIAVAIAERLWLLTGAVAGPLLPHLTNSPQRNPSLAAIVARHVFVLTAVAALLLFALSDVLIGLLYSPAFAPAVGPLCWLLPGIVSLSVGKILAAELLARARIVWTLWVSLITLVVNVSATLLLLPSMGISGAAAASTLSYTVLSALTIWYYLRETGVEWTALLPRASDLKAYTWLRLLPRAAGLGAR